MKNIMTQEERLNYLVDVFKADSYEYKSLKVPEDVEGKRRILRSLMNIRMPKPIDDEILAVQDEYLQERAREKGIVKLSDIAVIKDKISIWQGDITCLAVDAIVNAANSQMLGCFVPMHYCIDNCIHTFAGVQLRAECYKYMERMRAEHGKDYEQPTAIPVLTDAYNLPAKKIIHVTGPIVTLAALPIKPCSDLEKDLADCYINTLNMCRENNLKSVAFCCISTGVFNFPRKRAAEIAISTVEKWLSGSYSASKHVLTSTEDNNYNNNHNNNEKIEIERVIFNVFSDDDRKYYEKILFESPKEKLLKTPTP